MPDTKSTLLACLVLLVPACDIDVNVDGSAESQGATDGAETSSDGTATDPSQGTTSSAGDGTTGGASETGSDSSGGDDTGTAVPCQAESATTERVGQVSQYGITWTFDQPYDVGQFVNGDYFVVDPGSGVQITAVSPNPAGGVNGSMLNPSGNLQAYDADADQGFGDYDPSLAVGYPVTLAAGDSLISTETITNQTAEWNGSPLGASNRHVNTAAVLTVLETVPLEGTFRPPYAGTDKPLYHVCQVDASILPALSMEGMSEPSSGTLTGVAMLERGLERPWILHGWDWIGRQIHPVQNMNNYHEDVSAFWGMATAYLMTDRHTPTLLHRYIQTGIDAYHSITLPGAPTDSSHFATPIVITGLLLGDEDMQNTFIADAQNIAPRGHEKFYYHGDRNLGTSSSIVPLGQSWTGWTNDAGQAVFFSKQVGEEYEHLHPSEWECYSPHCKGEVYRAQHDVYGLVGQILALRILAQHGQDAEALYDHPAALDYIDRWMEEGFESEPFGDTGRTYYEEWQFHRTTTVFYRMYQSGGSSFVDEMWNAYR